MFASSKVSLAGKSFRLFVLPISPKMSPRICCSFTPSPFSKIKTMYFSSDSERIKMQRSSQFWVTLIWWIIQFEAIFMLYLCLNVLLLFHNIKWFEQDMYQTFAGVVLTVSWAVIPWPTPLLGHVELSAQAVALILRRLEEQNRKFPSAAPLAADKARRLETHLLFSASVWAWNKQKTVHWGYLELCVSNVIIFMIFIWEVWADNSAQSVLRKKFWGNLPSVSSCMLSMENWKEKKKTGCSYFSRKCKMLLLQNILLCGYFLFMWNFTSIKKLFFLNKLNNYFAITG